MLCLGKNKIKCGPKYYLLLLHLLFKSSVIKLSGTGFVFVLVLNIKRSQLLKSDSAKTAILGKISSLKPLCGATPQDQRTKTKKQDEETNAILI